ncbi:MAG: dihydroneopterin aldolase [Kiritimatiellia bacterium]|nr:dihydroneopterin aldolase [Kiritimatiellia bacterium]
MKSDNSDYIHIRGLRLRCHIGVSPQERIKKQVITADIALRCDLRRAGQSDRLMDTIDYSVMAEKITALAVKEEFCLLESLARRIAKICLADSKAKEVTVKVAKKGVLANARSVAVEITRCRDFNVCHSRPDPPAALRAAFRAGRESRNSKKTGFPLSPARRTSRPAM